MFGVTAPVILKKELLLIMRSRRAAWLLLLVLLFPSLAFWLFWLSRAAGTSFSARAEFSRSIFNVLSMIELCSLAIVAPVMTSSVVTAERENKTLDLLYASGIGRLSLLFGKWLSANGFLFLLIICLLPIFSLTLQLGGVGLDEYLFVAVLIVLSVAAYGMIGLAFSCWFRRSTTSLTVTLFMILAIFAISYAASLALAVSEFELIRRVGWDRGALHVIRDLVSPGVLGWVAAASPIGTWQSCLEGTATATTGSLFAHPVFRYHVLNQGILFLVSLSVAYWGLTHGRAERSITTKAVIDDAAVLSRRRKRWPFYLIDPLRRTQEIRDRQNPLYVKEKRVGVFSKGHMIVRVSYVGILFSIYLVYRVIADPGIRGLFGVSLLILSFLLVVIPLIASTVISREYEEDTMDLLRASLLTPRRIVWAKFLIVIRLLAVLSVGLLLMPSIFYAFPYLNDGMRETRVQTAVRVLPQLVSFTVLYAAIGVFCSTLWRRNIPAIVTTYGVFMLMNVFPWLLLGVIDWMDPEAPELGVELSREPPWIDLSIRRQSGPRAVPFLSQGGSPGAASASSTKPLVPASALFILKGVCPVISPYFYVALNRRGLGEYGHYFRAWNQWPVLISHAVLVLVLAGLFLVAASWRLRTGFRD